MKNKKLFAILTLVCFMFTLMPVAAFAATADGYVTVAGEEKYTATAGKAFTAKVTSGTAADYRFWAVDGDDEVVALSNDGSFTFDDVDTFYVYAVEATEAVAKVFANEAYTKAQVINIINDRYEDNIIFDYLTVKVKAADVTYKLAADVKDLAIKADNGWSKDGKVTVTLTKTGDKAVKNAAIDYTTNSGYVEVEVDEALTDRSGEQVIYITASKAGNYKVYANYEDAEELVINVSVSAKGIDTITTVVEPARGTALDTSFYELRGGFTGAAFEIVTADGTVLDSDLNKADYKITIVEKPEDSNLEADNLYLDYDATTNKAYVLKSTSSADSFDEEGTYVIKIALESGSAATATVKVVEFDEPVMMNLIYKANTVSYNDTVAKKALVYVDKNGTTLSAAHPDYSKMGTVKYAANGKAVKAVAANGDITTVDDDEVIGTTISVIAINDKLELTATATIEVVDKASTLAYKTTEADIAVNNKLIVNTVDENGKVINAGLDKDTDEVSVYVISAPANAVYYVKGAVTGVNEVTVDFTASAAGEYKLQTVVTDGQVYYSCVETITVGGAVGAFEDIVVVSIGANKMIVNDELVALDVAPFIENGRTKLQFNVLYVFGIDVEWVAETQSVVAEGNGIKVVMTLGSKVATVNGEEVALDVAPYSVNGRTVVPVGFITGTFGINPTFTYNADGTIADILFTK